MAGDLALQHVYEPPARHSPESGHAPARDDAPTLLLLHGTGGDEHDLLPLAPLLLPNAGVLSPRGNVLEHGMPRFFRRLAPGVFDVEDLQARTEELLHFIDAASAQYGFARNRVIAVGLSNGANIAANMLLTHGPVLDAAVLFRVMPVREGPDASLPSTEVYMNSGRRDRMITPALTQQLADRLQAAGATVTLEWDDAGHELTRGAVDSARRWLAHRA